MKKTIYLFITYMLIIPIIVSLFFYNNSSEELKIISSIIIVIFQILLYFFSYKDSIIKDIKNFKAKYILTALKEWIFLFITLIVLNAFIISIVGSQAANETTQRSIIAIYPILSIFTTGILGPISEELVFRKSIREVISNPKTFIIISSIIFGSAHLLSGFLDGSIIANPLQLLFIIPYSSMGIFFARGYIKTDNILTSTIMHIIHNTITILIIIGG